MSALPGRAMMFWLVPCVPRNICVGFLLHICSFIRFSQSFWIECSQGFWFGLSSGWRRTSNLGWILRTVVPALGCLWGRGSGTVSTVWLWGWSIAIMAMPAANWSSLGKFCVRLVVGHLWCQVLGGHTLLLRATRSIWEAGVCAECSITRLLMSGCSNGACKKLLPLCSGRSTHFRWRSSSWPVSKVLSIVIGCNRGNFCQGQLRQVTSPCLG